MVISSNPSMLRFGQQQTPVLDSFGNVVGQQGVVTQVNDVGNHVFLGDVPRRWIERLFTAQENVQEVSWIRYWDDFGVTHWTDRQMAVRDIDSGLNSGATIHTGDDHILTNPEPGNLLSYTDSVTETG